VSPAPKNIAVEIQRLDHAGGIDLPHYASPQAAGMDLRAAIEDPVLLEPGEDYRGEVGVILINMGDTPFPIQRGDRIAQMIIAPVSHVRWDETDHLPETNRGTGGFGSSGKR